MSQTMTKSSLSPGRRHLVELMQELNHGRILKLEVQGGKPILEPPPTVLRLLMFGKDNGPNSSRSNDDFILKKTVIEMFEAFDREQSFLIQELTIVDGLPVRMIVKRIGPV